ncbi:thymidine kinase, cytosolic-like [Scleropages formosus]|uniref:Thymidine kinase n=1 Tax=Scleropages formosus TaxID=113540 RepID=A0A0P7VAB1_SCLFO|nr:thymidine kinase, cytosolic [Scleropages formosus]XP_018600943.1 thymidine kinase, cytosolic [Scleropages formosus]KPP70063.1 thymidine kinase, cytosolic-like [Scleropages formosus]
MDCLNVARILPNSPRQASSRGQIQVIFGPMFSGKSTELMRRVRRFQVAQYRCLVVKYAKDTRYSEGGVATHDRNTMEAVPASCLQEIYSLALEATVIGIDEGQFFPDTVEFCEEMANMGKTVIIAALDGTFQRKPFGNILNLVPLAESVVKLNAVCMECFKEASYTKRLGEEKEVEVIGGADKYHAVCRACYSSLTAGKENRAPPREEMPSQAIPGKMREVGAPRKLFASLQLEGGSRF